MARLQQGDHAGAALAFALATQADPSAGPLWRNLAHAYRLGGDEAAERTALDRALDLDRTDFIALLRSAELHERTGEQGLALAAWSGVLQLAARLETIAPPLASALEHGRSYVATLQARVASQVDDALAAKIEAMDETGQRRMGAFVGNALGRRVIFENQCAGVRYPFLPADEFFDRSHFPWFETLEDHAPAIRRELEALLATGDDAIRPYVRQDSGTPDNLWSGLDHSLDWGACFLFEYGEPNQPVLDRCPETAAVIAKLPLAILPGRAPNVFFSLLRPRTRIPAHTGVTNTRAIVHLPLIVPDGCRFRVGGETRDWDEGKAFAFDDTIEHEAWNDSDEMRAVLILDVWNPHLAPEERGAITDYFAAADSAGLNPRFG